MKHLLCFLPLIEVLIFNLINLNYCVTRRYSILRTVTVLCTFTAFIILPGILFPAIEVYGNGQFSILGFIYIIPLKFLYLEKMELLFINMCMSWTYTLGIMAVSVQIIYFSGFSDYNLSLMIVEAILFSATFIPFKKYMIPKFSYILRNTHKVQKKQFAYLKTSICFNFFVLIILHMIFLNSEKYLLQITALVIFLATNYLFYHIVYEVISSSIQVHELEKTVAKDALTGLGNRTQLMKDMQYRMQENQLFSVLFLDLDKFKLINDQYGHDVGDNYLIHFAKVFGDELNDKGTLYRYGGDEFIAIYDGVLTREIIDSIAKCKNWNEDAPCEFNQVSIGLVVCEPPYTDKEPNNILKRADNIMYKNKVTRKIRNEEKTTDFLV